MIGQTISHFHILEKLGEGGMGVVYKAHDTELDRDVALKFLPHHISVNEAEQARFLQEARAAAVLNHPNICTVHAIEKADDQQFIVMEYVEGKTLRQLIPTQKTQIAIDYAVQIGDALQEAHSKGIVHRDVKADNIMVNSKNQIKVMDFGLAKLKGSLKLTKTSSTVGTLAYMAPEQIQGGEVDARSDIFSFGVVLYEMLTGHLPFRGEHEAAMMYSIVNEEPESVLKYLPDAPPELVHVLGRALEKDPGERYQTTLDMVIDLRRLRKHSTKVTRIESVRRETIPMVEGSLGPVLAGSQREIQPPRQTLSFLRNRRFLWVGLAAVVVIAPIIYVVRNLTSSDVSTSVPVHATFTQLTDKPGIEAFPDISPDGNFIVYTKYSADHKSIYLQRVGGGNPINLTGDSKNNDQQARFSPDGQSIAFCSDRGGGGIFVMGSTGESVRRVSDFGYNPTWSPDGREILCSTQNVFGPSGRTGAGQLWSIDASTGTKRMVLQSDAVQPDWSPRGYRIAYWTVEGGNREISTIPASGGEPVPVIQDAHFNWDPVWSPDGNYLYFSSDRGGSMSLWRVPIDEKSGKVLGELVPLTTPSPWSGQLRISHDGRRIVYMAMQSTSNIYRIAFDPRSEKVIGDAIPVTQGTKDINHFDPSPDGQNIVYELRGKQEDIFLIRSDGSDLRQLTNDIYKDRRPRWSPDGKRIAFYSNRNGQYEIWSINPDGSALSQLTKSSGVTPQWVEWLSDGLHIAYSLRSGGASVLDLRLPLDERKPEPIAPLGSGDTLLWLSAVSPDGKMLAGFLTPRATGEWKPGVVVYSLETKSYTKLTSSGQATAWLNDSRRVLFESNGRIWIVDSRTRKSHEVLTPQPNTDLGRARVSNDNRLLYFAVETREADVWLATLK